MKIAAEMPGMAEKEPLCSLGAGFLSAGHPNTCPDHLLTRPPGECIGMPNACLRQET
jgi:hypothetical protein